MTQQASKCDFAGGCHSEGVNPVEKETRVNTLIWNYFSDIQNMQNFILQMLPNIHQESRLVREVITTLVVSVTG